MDMVRAESPALILMDMNFTLSTTGEEGLTLLKQVKVFRPDVPVILMTAWALRQLRKQIAEREHTPAYIIFSDDSLEDMVEKKPVTLDQFSDIRGVGQIKLDRYGKVFVALIRFVLKLPK